jgi:hypothetical protein
LPDSNENLPLLDSFLKSLKLFPHRKYSNVKRFHRYQEIGFGKRLPHRLYSSKDYRYSCLKFDNFLEEYLEQSENKAMLDQMDESQGRLIVEDPVLVIEQYVTREE